MGIPQGLSLFYSTSDPAPFLLIGLLAACVRRPQAMDTASDDSGPTLYGQIGVSIDHTSVK